MKKTILLSLILLVGTSYSSYSAQMAEPTEKPAMSQSGDGYVIEPTSTEKFLELFDLDEDSEDILVGDKGVVLYFTATWCGPCKGFSPKYDQAARAMNGKVDFYKIDIDKFADLAEFFEVESVPTVLLISPENLFDRLDGAPSDMTGEQLATMIELFFFGE